MFLFTRLKFYSHQGVFAQSAGAIEYTDWASAEW